MNDLYEVLNDAIRKKCLSMKKAYHELNFRKKSFLSEKTHKRRRRRKRIRRKKKKKRDRGKTKRKWRRGGGGLKR